MYDIIKDMYKKKNNKCCVKVYNRITDFFLPDKSSLTRLLIKSNLIQHTYINVLATEITRSAAPGLKLLNEEKRN